MVSAFFPPIGGVGVQRITKFVRHLPELGWNPIVLTVPTYSTRMPKDPSMINDVPESIKIYRPFFYNYRKIVPGEINKLINPITKRIFYPDLYVPWNYFVFRTVEKIIKKQKIDVAFFNLSPFSTMLLAEKIKREFHLPVILNLRDPFSFNNYLIIKNNPQEISRAQNLERTIFPKMDAIIGVTPYIVEQYRALLPELKDKIQLITNGYDETDFANLDPEKSKHTANFTIGYNGSVSSIVPIQPLLKAIYHLYQHKNITIKLNIASNDSFKKISSQCPDCARAGLIEYKGFLPHAKSLENLCNSHILAIMFKIDATTDGAYSGKIFEYLRMKKPILLLNKKDSQVAKLIQETKTGTAVNIDNQEEIQQALLFYYEQWKNNQLVHQPNWEKIRQFDYRELTKKLAAIFNNLAGRE